MGRADPRIRKIKCRYCAWSTPPWILGEAGNKLTGMERFADHLVTDHPDKHGEPTDHMMPLRQGYSARTTDG